MNLHIASVFIILLSSAVGVCLPILTQGFAQRGAMRELFFAARYFGTGVIISTALGALSPLRSTLCS